MDLRGEKRLNYGDLFQDWEIAIAKRLINDFRREWKCLRYEDPEDLLQDCLSQWQQVKPEFDSNRGANWQTFMATIVRNRLVNIVRGLVTDKRKMHSQALALDEPIGDGENSATLLDTIENSALDYRASESIESHCLNIDVAGATQQLSSRQRKLCDLLSQGFGIAEISRILKTPRGTIYDELRRIRTLFEDAGLREYLK